MNAHDGAKTMSLMDAAIALGVDYPQVRTLVLTGVLNGGRTDAPGRKRKTWFVEVESVERYKDLTRA